MLVEMVLHLFKIAASSLTLLGFCSHSCSTSCTWEKASRVLNSRCPVHGVWGETKQDSSAVVHGNCDQEFMGIFQRYERRKGEVHGKEPVQWGMWTVKAFGFLLDFQRIGPKNAIWGLCRCNCKNYLLLLTHRWVFQSIQLLWRVSRKGRQNHSWQYFADGNWRIAVESSNPPMLTEDLAVILNWLGFAWPKHRIQQVLSQVEMPCKTQRFWKHHCIYQIYRIISYIWINIYIYANRDVRRPDSTVF